MRGEAQPLPTTGRQDRGRLQLLLPPRSHHNVHRLRQLLAVPHMPSMLTMPTVMTMLLTRTPTATMTRLTWLQQTRRPPCVPLEQQKAACVRQGAAASGLHPLHCMLQVLAQSTPAGAAAGQRRT